MLGLLRGLTASLDVSQSYLEVMTPYARKALADKYIKHKADMDSALTEKQGGGNVVSITKVLLCIIVGCCMFSALSLPYPTLYYLTLPCCTLPYPALCPTPLLSHRLAPSYLTNTAPSISSHTHSSSTKYISSSLNSFYPFLLFYLYYRMSGAKIN